jgi:hypothetical protein
MRVESASSIQKNDSDDSIVAFQQDAADLSSTAAAQRCRAAAIHPTEDVEGSAAVDGCL